MCPFLERPAHCWDTRVNSCYMELLAGKDFYAILMYSTQLLNDGEKWTARWDLFHFHVSSLVYLLPVRKWLYLEERVLISFSTMYGCSTLRLNAGKCAILAPKNHLLVPTIPCSLPNRKKNYPFWWSERQCEKFHEQCMAVRYQ